MAANSRRFSKLLRPPPLLGSAHDVDALCVRLVEPPPPPPPHPQQPAQCCKKLAFFARSSKIRDRILKFHRISLKIEMTRFFFYATLSHPKVHPHTKGIPISRNIGDMHRTRSRGTDHVRIQRGAGGPDPPPPPPP